MGVFNALKGAGLGGLGGAALGGLGGLFMGGPYGAISGAMFGGSLGAMGGGTAGLFMPDYGAMNQMYNPAMMGYGGMMSPYGGFGMPNGLFGGYGGAYGGMMQPYGLNTAMMGMNPMMMNGGGYNMGGFGYPAYGFGTEQLWGGFNQFGMQPNFMQQQQQQQRTMTADWGGFNGFDRFKDMGRQTFGGGGWKTSSYLDRQDNLPELVSMVKDTREVRKAPYKIQRGAEQSNYRFRGKKVDAQKHEVQIDGRSIEVVTPKRRNPADGQFHSAKEVAEALAMLPPESRANVKRVVINPQANPEDSYWGDKFGDKDFNAYATAGRDGTVTFYPTHTKHSTKAMSETMSHEIGHFISHKMDAGKDGTAWRDWERAIKSDGNVPSKYARNNRDEDFAESYALFDKVRGTQDEAAVRQKMPARFALIEKLIAQG